MKTKLGISNSLLAAIVFFVALFNGYVGLLLLVGYILICETDPFLKRNSVKALTLMLVFSAASSLISFIPDLITMIDEICGIFNGNFNIFPLTSFTSFLLSVVAIARKALFLVMGLLALSGKEIKIAPLDKLFDGN